MLKWEKIGMMHCVRVDDKNKKEYNKVFSRRYREIFVTKATLVDNKVFSRRYREIFVTKATLVDKREREAFILRASRTTKSP